MPLSIHTSVSVRVVLHSSVEVLLLIASLADRKLQHQEVEGDARYKAEE